jgi:hypothetical protein
MKLVENRVLAVEWHPTKNGELSPDDVTTGSRKKVWWKCPKGPDHEWQARVKDRTSGHGCPFCSNRQVSVTNSLARLHPRLLRQWDWEQNRGINPRRLTIGSRLRVWWRCPKGSDHVWQGTVAGRVREKGPFCPFCAKRRLSITNSLSKVRPDLAAQWHPTKNGELRPTDIPFTWRHLVWWKCPREPDHEWQARCEGRIRKRGARCPYCLGFRVTASNSLARVRPAVARTWHPTKNGRITPADVFYNSRKHYWWRCERGHEFATSPAGRVQHGCPYCTHRFTPPEDSMARRRPDMARLWHPTKNGKLLPEDVLPASEKKFWWKCPKGPDHEWQASAANRKKGKGHCPFCLGRRVCKSNSLLKVRPDLARTWHPTKNGERTPRDVFVRSTTEFWWKCEQGHEFKTSPRQRALHRCRYCTSRCISPQRSLARRFPMLARQWHPTKNGSLTPLDVGCRVPTKVWWRCPKGPDHEWRASIVSRTSKRNGTRCPCCFGRLLSVTNSLAARFPKLARQWHPTRNGHLTPRDILAGSETPVWWQCPVGHAWRAPPGQRARERGSCPICRPRRRRSATVRQIDRHVRLPKYEGSSAARGRAR